MTFVCVCGEFNGRLKQVELLLLNNLTCPLSICCVAVTPTGLASECVDEDSDVEIVFVREPTAKQAALAKALLLPPTFFCYQGEPGYSSEDETDGEREKF